MKKLLFLLLAFNIHAQTLRPSVFTYSYQISNGTFSAIFANNTTFQVLGVGTSQDSLGWISFSCREDFSPFLCNLYNWGNTTAHIPTRGWQGLDLIIGDTHFILQTSHPFILIVDNLGRTWKLTKPEAFALGNILKEHFLEVPICNPCNCIQTN